MSKKEINKEINLLSKHLAECANKISERFNVNIIHEFRSVFKKLRALLRWQKEDKKLLNPLKEIYHIAGELRNNQLVLKKLALEKTEIPEFVNELNFSIDQQKQEWKKNLKQKQLIKALLHIPLKNKANSNKYFFTKKIKKINQLILLPSISDTTIHEIRKLIKDMEYVITLLKTKENKEIIDENKKQLDSLGRQLGDYMDKYISLTTLQLFKKNKKSPLKKLSQLEKKWRHTKDAQRKQLLQLLTIKTPLLRLNGQYSYDIK